MPPRLRLRSLAQLADLCTQRASWTCMRCQYATVTAITPAPTEAHIASTIPSLSRHNPLQPPSHRDPKYRKSQLIRQYVSMLDTTPLLIFFQHNNLIAKEWAGIRRELDTAMRKLDEQLLGEGADPSKIMGSDVKIEVIRTTMFRVALGIAEYYNPSLGTPTSMTSGRIGSEKEDPALTHALSEAAYNAAKRQRGIHPLSPILSGSLAVLSLPTVSPHYVKTALSILSPKKPNFPAPTRRAQPYYYEVPVQDGVNKLLLLGARIDRQVFDLDGTRWVGTIEGGIEGLRAEIVSLLQGFGASLTTTLESASRSVGGGLASTLEGSSRNLWVTMESRRKSLEEGSNPGNERQGS